VSLNILLIVADDLNSWVGALGRHPDVQTPHIDALAERGALFSHAYCPAPYCNASRVATYTGRLPSTTGVYANEPYWQQPDRPPTIVERLQQAGYYTFGAGKVFHGGFRYERARKQRADVAVWNDSENRLMVWDDFVVNTPDHLRSDRPVNGLFDAAELDTVPKFNYFDWGPLPDDVEPSMPDANVADAVSEFLRHPVRQPFFCAAGLYKPHLPWYVPQRYFDLYHQPSLSLPLVKEDDLDDVPPIGRKWALDAPNHYLVRRGRQWRPAVHAYLASISYCDARVGEILAALDASPAREQTAVVLFGDNGFHLGEKLHWRKFALWEEATQVPLVVFLPGGRPGVRVHQPVSLLDLFPTLLELTGLEADGGAEGQSLVRAASGTGDPPSGPARMTWGRGNHSIRSAEWRYTRYVDGGEELYDHRVDPYEWHNLAANSRYDDVRRELAAWVPDDR
jgi:arylsulfatase A-like enzyme